MTQEVELRMPADVRYVGLARLVVSATARQAGMAADRLEDLKLAVSEATANAVQIHREAGLSEPVVLRFGPRDSSFEVTVVDAGPGFEPGSEAEFEDREWESKTGGMGVTLIRGLTDQCHFVQDSGMHVNMRFAVGMDSDN